MNIHVPQKYFAHLFFTSHPHCPSLHPLQSMFLSERLCRSLKRSNQSPKNKSIAAKPNLQVETDPSQPLTLPCEFLCLVAILLTAGGMCFQMFSSEMLEVSPGGIRRVRCVYSFRVRDLLLASAGLKTPSVREPSAEWEDGNPIGFCLSPWPSSSFMGSHRDPVVYLIPIGCQLPDTQVCKNSQLFLQRVANHNCQGLERGSWGLGLVYALLSVIFNSKLIARIKPTVK